MPPSQRTPVNFCLKRENVLETQSLEFPPCWQRGRHDCRRGHARLQGPYAIRGAARRGALRAVTGAALVRKEQRCTNRRCEYCWHDRAQRCMCHRARPHSLHTTVNVKVLVLMHSKEYLNPGTDAKLLLAMLPPLLCTPAALQPTQPVVPCTLQPG